MADHLDELDPVLQRAVAHWRQSSPGDEQTADVVARLLGNTPVVAQPPLWLRLPALVAASLLLLQLVRVPAAWAEVNAVLEQPANAAAPGEDVRAAWRGVLMVHVSVVVLGLVVFLAFWLLWTVSVVLGLFGWQRLAAWLRRATPPSVLAGALLWTLGIILGALWARAVLGRYWDWDPRETYALPTAAVAFLWWWAARRWRSTALGSLHASFAAVAFWLIALCYWLSVFFSRLHAYGLGPSAAVILYGALLNGVLLLSGWWQEWRAGRFGAQAP